MTSIYAGSASQIIIVIYNSTDKIIDLLQQLHNFEIIIVNNGKNEHVISKIKAHKNVKSINFNIDVVNGIAYLSGIARTKKEMNLVLAYTKETRYVNQLVNYIQLSETLSQ